MIKLAIVSLSVATLAAALVGCDDPNELTGRQNVPKPGEEGSLTPEALQCTDKPEGRSYVLFDGTKLEQERRNENIGINRARFKPFAVLAGEYQRVLGAVPPSLEGSGASFDDPPARWYAEANHSGVSLNAMFDISFEACAESVKKQADLAQAPAEASARTYCTTLIRKAWSRSGTPAEVDGCVELATKKLGDEPNAQRKWSYVCASILSSSYFLTF